MHTRRADGTERRGVVAVVHTDDATRGLYYTVMLDAAEGGAEVQTTADRLRPAACDIISAEPEVTVFTRQRGDKVLVLASDGVWDVMPNADCVSFVARQGRDRAFSTWFFADVSRNLVLECLERGSDDNITAIVVPLVDEA